MVSAALEIVLFTTIYSLRSRQERERQAQSTMLATVREGARETIDLFKRLLGQSAFARILVFFLLIGFLKAIFLQMDYVFPKFGDRVLGMGAPVGRLANINGWMIIVLAPVVGALTQRFSAYRMVIIGGAICAA